MLCNPFIQKLKKYESNTQYMPNFSDMVFSMKMDYYGLKINIYYSVK